MRQAWAGLPPAGRPVAAPHPCRKVRPDRIVRSRRKIVGVAHTTDSASDPDGGASLQRVMTALVQLLASLEATEVRRWGDLGLTIGQLRVLHQLRDRPASCGQVADHLGVTASTATALIDRMVRRGLLERTVREGDRRVTDLHLSETGRHLLEESVRRKRVIRTAMSDLLPADQERLAAMLERLAAGVQAAEAAVSDAEPATSSTETAAATVSGVGS